MNTFSLATYNAHDRGTPPIATIVAIQERPPSLPLERALTFHDIAYPGKSALAIAWDRDLVTKAKARVTFIHGGRRKVSPSRYLLTLRCRVRGEKVAVINTHLVNNAFGKSIRGERAQRRRWWNMGWDSVNTRRLALTARGYRVFVVGDFNRRSRDWRDGPDRVIGNGYDRLFYPTGVELLRAWRGDKGGSDHAPILGQFKFKGDK